MLEVELLSTGADSDSDQALVWVEWDDGFRRPLAQDMLEDIELGLGVTLHETHGSQWARITLLVTTSKLLDRTVLYTAFTRAQTQVILVETKMPHGER